MIAAIGTLYLIIGAPLLFNAVLISLPMADINSKFEASTSASSLKHLEQR